MVEQLTGEMLILGAKQSCRGYLLRLRIKSKHLSVKTFTLESLEKSEGEEELGRQQFRTVEMIKTRVFHSLAAPRGERSSKLSMNTKLAWLFCSCLPCACGRITNEFVCKMLFLSAACGHIYRQGFLKGASSPWCGEVQQIPRPLVEGGVWLVGGISVKFWRK